jgi:hypothetical protein
MDTPYHPNPACRRIRTEELIRRLRPALGLSPASDNAPGIFLLAGNNHRITDGNLFQDDPPILFRYISHESSPYAISPEKIADLAQSGTPLYTDSEESKPLLESAGLTLQLQSHQTQTIPQWFAQYPKAIFCIATAPNHPLDPIWKSAIPSAVYQQLTNSSATAAIFGPGISPILATEINNHLLRPDGIPCIISLQSSPAAKITVDDREFLSSSTGICVVAIDPEMGIVLNSAIFNGPDIETWRIYRVVPHPTPHRAL